MLVSYPSASPCSNGLVGKLLQCMLTGYHQCSHINCKHLEINFNKFLAKVRWSNYIRQKLKLLIERKNREAEMPLRLRLLELRTAQ